MTIGPDTRKADALRVLVDDDVDGGITAAEVGTRMDPVPSDATMIMKRLYDDEYVARNGKGHRGDPYRYEPTPKGVRTVEEFDDDQPEDPTLEDAAKRDAVDHEGEYDEDEPSGLDVLFPDDDETHADPDVVDRLEDLKRTVDAFGERIAALEDVAGSNNVAREDIKHRLRQIEDRVDEYEDADRLVAFDKGEVVRLVDMVAQSDARSGRKRREMIATILGYSSEDPPSTLSKATSDDAETTDTD